MSETRRAAIVMSRMPRLIDPQATWLGGLRASLRQIQANGQILVIAPGTAGSEFIARGAARLGIGTELLSDIDLLNDPAQRDQQLINNADEVFVLAVRNKGNIHRLLSERLKVKPHGVNLVDLPDLPVDAAREELLGLGATLWKPTSESCQPFIGSDVDEAVDQLPIVNFESYPKDLGDQFLIHTTRACPGPWPQQRSADYLDAILDVLQVGHHTALMTLSRIIRQQLLIGSGRTIRDGFPVVSFTAVPLQELPELRCFRTHRSRWDFEPYGICIRRAALERCGVRPVCYGTDDLWQSLSVEDRPFFQLNDPEPAIGNPTLDWSTEREWRHVGNLDLAQFSPRDIFVFVPTFADARFLQAHCPWSITLWPGEIK
jgi:hypothetical protein